MDLLMGFALWLRGKQAAHTTQIIRLVGLCDVRVDLVHGLIVGPAAPGHTL